MSEGIFFTSAEHRVGFLTAMQGIDKVYDGKLDQEYGAALYILTSSTGLWQKSQDYVSRSGIDFETMLEEIDFSGGYSVLVKLASNLFNSNTHLDPVELMRLDDTNFAVALNAIQLRRTSLHLKEQKA